nr:expressed conserved protein [Hymenolepis microstoma]
MDESESELTEVFMDRWVIIGIVCGVILGVVVLVTIVSLLICFIWRRKHDSPKDNGYRNKNNNGGSDSDSSKKKSSSYGPPLRNSTQSYYVQPSDDRKLAPSAEMFHYQYQKDQNSSNLAYPPTSAMSPPPGYMYEVPGLASQRDDDKEIANPLYGK